MKNNLKERFTVSFYEGNFKDDVLLKAVNFHSNSDRFRGNKIKEWAYEYIKEHSDLLKEMEIINNSELIATSEDIIKERPKSKKEEQQEKLSSKLGMKIVKHEE